MMREREGEMMKEKEVMTERGKSVDDDRGGAQKQKGEMMSERRRGSNRDKDDDRVSVCVCVGGGGITEEADDDRTGGWG